MKKVRSPNDEGRMTKPGGGLEGLGHEPAKAGTVPGSARTRGTVPVFEDRVAESIRRRVAKYDAKTTPERTSAILAAKVARMRENYRVQAEMQGRVDHRVSEVTDAAGVSVIMRVLYKDYGREVAKVWRTIPSSSQEVEYDVVRYKWTARGLDPILLARVKAAVILLLDESGFPRKCEPGL